MGGELLVLVLLCLGLQGNAQFTDRPRNLVAESNTAVTLSCETELTSSSRNMIWSRSDGIDNFEIIAIDDGIESGFEGRYSVVYQSRTGVGSPSTSRSVLTIEDVQPREAGTYYCNYLTFDAYSQLVVIESEPQTSSNVTLDEVIEGESIGLSCFVSYSSAISWSPQILWREASTGELTAIDQSTAGEARFVYAAPVVRTDHGNSYQCTAAWEVIPEDQIPEAIRGDHDLDEPDYSFASNGLGLTVLYPVENLDLTSRKSVYNPGESIAITADGRPDVKFRWHSLIDNTTIEEPLLPITAEMEGLQVLAYLAYNMIRGQSYERRDFVYFLVEIPATTTTVTVPTPPPISPTTTTPEETTTDTAAIVLGTFLGLSLVYCIVVTAMYLILRKKTLQDKKGLEQEKKSVIAVTGDSYEIPPVRIKRGVEPYQNLALPNGDTTAYQMPVETEGGDYDYIEITSNVQNGRKQYGNNGIPNSGYEEPLDMY